MPLDAVPARQVELGLLMGSAGFVSGSSFQTHQVMIPEVVIGGTDNALNWAKCLGGDSDQSLTSKWGDIMAKILTMRMSARTT